VCCLWLFGLFWFVWFSFLFGFVLLFYWVGAGGEGLRRLPSI
jgi:hypothetical protein